MSGDQPRQPKDMKGLLKFCFEATKAEDAPDISDPEKILHDMEPEQKKWLEEALSSMSVDIVQQLTNGIRILNSEAEDEEKEEVLDLLEDWLGSIDMAINFHKIGGFSCLRKCLQSSSPGVRAGACHLMAEISQNNTYCQEKFVNEGFIQLLLQQLDSDSDSQCQVKALYAISCIARDSPETLTKLGDSDGWSVVLRAVQRDNVKLVTKGCFFITASVVASSLAARQMLDMGMVTQLAGLLAQEFSPHHEQVLAALRALMNSFQEAKEQAKEAGLERLLLQRREELRGQEEFEESVEHCEKILQLLAPEFLPTGEWQEVQEWQGVPPGLHVKVDLESGRKMARREEASSADR